MKMEMVTDYRVRELLSALNEGLVEEEFVRAKLLEWAGDQVDLIHYSDGEYDVLSVLGGDRLNSLRRPA